MLLNEKDDRVKALLKIAGINIIRKRGQLSQEALADRAGVSRSTIVKIEAGKNISLKSLLKISKALGVEPGDLFLSDEDKADITYKFKLLVDMFSIKQRDDKSEK